MCGPIDFVLLWVDGNDPAWQKEKAKYDVKAGGVFTDSGVARYRDWGNLQYWFRGVEKFTPWVNRIHFVTWGHLPSWLNTEHPKLHVVNHRDFIPEQYLPVFNCNPIEINIHRIPEISEDFVYFNDDCFIIDQLKPTDFFRDGVPCDTAALTVPINHGLVAASSKLLSMYIINEHFTKRTAIYNHLDKWFDPRNGREIFRTLLLMPWGFIPDVFTAHGPNSYTKTLFEEVWEKEPEFLTNTCTHRFRSSEDIVQHLFKAWQICSGVFVPRKPLCRSYGLFSDRTTIKSKLLGQKTPIICLNDENDGGDFEPVKADLLSWFGQILPDKSSFEK